MLSVRNLNAQAGAFALRGVNLEVAAGAYCVVLGPSGAGKSVLLETIAGIRRADSGEIAIDEKQLQNAAVNRRGVALVYQDQALFPHLSVADNIAYGMRVRRVNKQDRNERVRALAEEVGVVDKLNRKPAFLSGGERQRVAIARALATNPRVLLLDEPLAALDAEARSAMRALLRRIHAQGQTVIHVTHDYEEAISLADHVAVIEDGVIAEAGTPAQVFQHPKSRFTARFIGIRNFYGGTLRFPDGEAEGLGEFTTKDRSLWVVTDAAPGRGFLLLRSEDLTLSREAPAGSARNVFEGTVIDIEPARLGMEVVVDIGVEVAALVTSNAITQLNLAAGAPVWLSFKATAARVIPE